ncbi:hypothetical protein GCM10009854_22960 [Saccharopolyspora halophila]|uniref:Uncharacterized protein n=1 Tax=Saccharopolyspora halophila TaxID=405551 RepID=A0ABN3G716_9PSEU
MPVEQIGFDLDHARLGDPLVGEHLAEGEAQPEPADQHAQPVPIDPAESLTGQQPLGLGVRGVHHENTVDAQFQGVVPTLQDQLTALAHSPPNNLNHTPKLPHPASRSAPPDSRTDSFAYNCRMIMSALSGQF